MLDSAAVLEIEQATLAAWPALETMGDGSWQARFANGYTKRANSIHVLDPFDDGDAGIRLDNLSREYEGRGLVPTFRITPLAGPGIEQALAARHWGKFEDSLVLSTKLVPARATRVDVLAPNSAVWLDAQERLQECGAGERKALTAIVGRIASPAAGLVLFGPEGQPLASALAVVAGDIGVYLNVVTAKAARRQGHGRAVMQAALAWTYAQGARRGAIQVLAGNAPALSIYQGLGFEIAYGYHYRRPQPGGRS